VVPAATPEFAAIGVTFHRKRPGEPVHSTHLSLTYRAQDNRHDVDTAETM